MQANRDRFLRSMVGVSPRNHRPKASMSRLIRFVLLDRFRMLMKSASLISTVFAFSTLLFAWNSKAASTVTAFDGTWYVSVTAHEYKNHGNIK
jgi:hypothetical protein